jgi:hypothetical protein
VINILITFPVHKLMFRQQVHGLRVADALAEMRREGVACLWRGVAPPLLQRGTSVAVMFATFHVYTDALDRAGLPPLMSSALAGAASGVSEAALTPFERLQTMMQHRDYNAVVRNSAHAARHCLGHGVKELYRGFTPVLLRCVATNTAFFTLRKPLKEAVVHAWEGDPQAGAPAEPQLRLAAAEAQAGMAAHEVGPALAGVSATQRASAVRYHVRITPDGRTIDSAAAAEAAPPALGTPAAASVPDSSTVRRRWGGSLFQAGREVPFAGAAPRMGHPRDCRCDVCDALRHVAHTRRGPPAVACRSRSVEFAANFLSGGLLGAVVGLALYPFRYVVNWRSSPRGPAMHPQRNQFLPAPQLY